MGLRDRDWNHIYESHTGEDSHHLVNDFYVPALQNSEQYDRITGFFSTEILNIASRGIEELFQNDGEMRLITGVLEEKDKEILSETVLEDVLLEELETPITDKEESRFSLIAELLNQNRLEIKVAEPKSGNWGLFHPKLGIFYDGEDRLAFEGSINETRGAWIHNYERFKIHRSWEEGERKYVETDEDTFEALWKDEHPHVDVYDLPEAIEEEIVEWRPSDEQETEDHVEKLREKTEEETVPVTEIDKAQILDKGGLSVGGIHIAEEASTIEPWTHQRVVSDTAVSAYPNGFLFCDEVGLGKTIETGLTLSRLMVSGEVRNTLILPPAGLVRQFQEELWEKFNINVYRYDRGTGNRLTFTDPLGNEYDPPSRSQAPDEDWAESPIWRFVHEQERPTVIIMSAHTAIRERYWDMLMPSEDRTREKYPPTRRGKTDEGQEGVWDAVVVDEAHHAREGTKLLELLTNLREYTRCYYLLTATPMQIKTEELYDLLSLLDIPEEWSDEDRFTQFFETRRALETVLDNIQEVGAGGRVGQSKLSGEYQSTLNPDTVSKTVLTELSQELELDGGEEQARNRILDACSLARSYGRQYDDYNDKISDRIFKDVPIDQRSHVEELLQTQEMSFTVVSEKDRRKAVDALEMEGWRLLPDVFSWSTPVDAHLFRNTRETLRKYEDIGLLNKNVPDRDPVSKTIQLGEETEKLYNKIEEYISKFYKESMKMEGGEAQAIGFVMTTYRQRLTSSIYAISQSLSRRLDNLKEKKKAIERGQRRDEKDERTQAVLESLSSMSDVSGLEDGGKGEFGVDITTELVTGDTDEGLKILEEEIEELESFIHEVRLVQKEPKINELYGDIQDLHDDGFDRIIIFTQYKDTMHAVRDELVGDFEEQVASYSSDGGEMYDPSTGEWSIVSKERVKRSFRNEGGVKILVCTDSASEGLNLQECGALINFDLPWNPMKVEQRIGRIDRIGQKHDPVRIINYFYEDTVETKIYDRLGDRINDFEEVVGTMQPILSGVEGSIQELTLDEGVSRTSTSADIDKALKDFEDEIDEKEQEMEDETVDIGESLEDTELDSREEVRADALLDAWKDSVHPDIGKLTEETYPYQAPFTPEAVEEVLTKSRILRNKGIVFESATEIEKDVSLEESDLEEMYLVKLQDDFVPENLQEEHQDTVAYELAPESDRFVVTFDPNCADDFPSVRYLMSGDFLFESLVEEILDSQERAISLEEEMVGETDGEYCVPVYAEPYVVRGWFNGEKGVGLDQNGEISSKGYTEDDLHNWCSEFRENR